MKIVNATKYHGKPLINMDTAKKGLIVVMYYGKPCTALAGTVLVGLNSDEYKPQKEAFASKCSEFCFERDLAMTALEEMLAEEARSKTGEAKKNAELSTTLGQVNAVVNTWPIKARVSDCLSYKQLISSIKNNKHLDPLVDYKYKWISVRKV